MTPKEAADLISNLKNQLSAAKDRVAELEREQAIVAAERRDFHRRAEEVAKLAAATKAVAEKLDRDQNAFADKVVKFATELGAV